MALNNLLNKLSESQLIEIKDKLYEDSRKGATNFKGLIELIVEEENLSIDIPEKSQLIAYGHSKEEVRQIIGSDTLEYLSLPGLRKACGGGDFYEKYFGGNYPLEEKRRLG